jgi:hypothetical protein
MNTNPVMDVCAADKVGGEIHLWLSFVLAFDFDRRF